MCLVVAWKRAEFANGEYLKQDILKYATSVIYSKLNKNVLNK